MLYLEIINRISGQKTRKEFADEKSLWSYCEEKGLLFNLNVTLRQVYEF